jgi:hypothetical protein
MRCEAIWIGPTKKCGLPGDWAASGAGSSEAKARKNAVARLLTAVNASAELDTIRRPLALTDPKRCVAEAEAGVRIECFAEPSLWEKRRCYVDLPVEGCGSPGLMELSGVQWRVTEKGRSQMCKALAKRLRKTDLRTQWRCRAICAQQVRVRCPRPE